MADRIWNEGISGVVTSQPGESGPDRSRERPVPRGAAALDARGLWTDDPEFLIERSTALDISMLGLAVPFGLLPASDPRMVRTAEASCATTMPSRANPTC